MKPLCIYHGNCADGFGAAWVVRRFFSGEVDFHAGVYQNPPPDVVDRDVILVDFSYKRDLMLNIRQSAKSVLVLDHHKSAAEDLIGSAENFVDLSIYSGELNWQRHVGNIYQDKCEGVPYAAVYMLFDMERSGAGIAWDFFFPNEARPKLINHIEDRDLWKFALFQTREIQAAVFSYPYDFKTWDWLMTSGMGPLAVEGTAIERKHHKDVAELVAVTKRRMIIGGQTVWGASLPYTLTSDAGHMMAEAGEPFAACYWDTPDGRVFSLRSRDDGADVSEIAKQYGGGGHKHASGFRIPFSRLAEFEAAP